MKRHTFLSLLFASLTLCTLLSACADRDAVIDTLNPDTLAEVQPFTISATIGDAVQTRTTLNEQSGRYSMVWAAGDQISVVYPGSGFDVAHRFTLSAGEGSKSGTFTDSGQIHNGMLGQGTDGACATNAPYYIGYYPEATFSTWRSGVFLSDLHTTQTYDPNGPDNYPMYAFTTDLSDMKFEGINSVLQLNVSSSVGDYKVKYIKVAGAGIAGSAGVVVKTDAEGKPYGELAIGGNVPNITLVCNDEPISATAKPFYIHLIPGHQSNLTIKLILENADGTQCVSTFSANNLDFAARGLYPIDLNINNTPAADKSAEPIRGVDLNDKIKKLVNSSAHSGMTDNTIKTINFIPNSSKQGTVISTRETAYAVYASLEGDVVNVTTLAEKFTLGADCNKVFYRLAKLEQINGLEYVDTQAVTDFSSMFDGCSALKSLDLSTWDTSSATTMKGMFCNCSSLTSLELRNFNTSSVTDMNSMFFGCRNLTELNISSFNTSSVGSFASMFLNLQHLATLDLRSFNMSSANDYSSMFSDSKGLTNVYLPDKFFPSSCYSWDEDWNDSESIVIGALSGITVNYMLSGTAQGSTCTFHCQEEKDVKILNAIQNTNGSGCGTLNIEYSSLAVLSGDDIEDLKSIIQTNKETLTSVKFNVEQTRPSDVTADYWITINANTLTVNTDKKRIQMGTPDGSVDLWNLFAECSQLTTIDLSSVTKIYSGDMSGMFINCYKLEELRFCPYFNIPEDVGTWDMITKVGKDLPAGTKCKIYGCTADVQAKMTSESSDYNVEFK